MKLQSLAIIFILLILPISILLSAYTQNRVQTLNLQSEYDSKLNDATYDALKAYQINSLTSSSGDFTNSKMRDIKASVNTFFTSMSVNFSNAGYTKSALQSYVPALVYTMYDGYYIYSPYTNTWDDETVEKHENDTSYSNDEKLYGLKPYVYYSCRYKSSSYDIIITYALDNYIQIQGLIENEPINESGYLLSNIEKNGDTYKYNGIEIPDGETLREYVLCSDDSGNEISGTYPYIKKNGMKYYAAGRNDVFYVLNGKKMKQSNVTYNEIMSNSSAYEYYEDAYRLKRLIENYLSDLSTKDIVNEDGTKYQNNGQDTTYTNFTKIFDFNNTNGIESSFSNFNTHRTEVIKHSIERNLSIAINNFNNFSSVSTNFQMPKLKDEDWDKIMDNISIISFLQGINIGGKIFNGYSIITNTKNEDVVMEDSIYILTDDGTAHRVTETGLENMNITQGIFNVNLERRTEEIASVTKYYFPISGNLSYESIVAQNNVEDINNNIELKKYLTSSGREYLGKIYYTALGRERYSLYNRTKLDTERISRNKYQVGLDNNGGNSTINEIYVVEGKKYDNLPKPTRPGYTFDGWFTKPVGGELITKDSVVSIKDDTILYAHWTANTYTITFYGNGGNVSATTKRVTYDQTYGTLPTPTRPGYTFSHWSTSKSGTTRITADSTVKITTNTTLFAIWEEKSFTVSFDGNGGTLSSTETKKVTYDEKYGTLPTATRPGYTLAYWSTSKTGEPQINEDSTVKITADTVLYAIWEANKYTISFDGNDGTVSSANTIEVTYDQKYGTLPTATRPGYVLSYWSTSKTGETKITADSIVKITDDTTLYAIWTLRTYKVTLNANGGSVSPASINVTYDGTYSSLPTASRSGYTFIGWFTAANGGVQITNATKVTITADTTLYAHWTAKTYTVTYNGNGGVATASRKTVTYNSAYGELASASRVGYTFAGWYTAASGGTRILETTTYTTVGDTTLYAHWNQADWTAPTITRDENGTFSHLVGTANPFLQATYNVNDTGGSGTAAYYWGTSIPTASSAWTDFQGGTQIVKVNISAEIRNREQTGTYYFGAKDNCGNISYVAYSYKVLFGDKPSSYTEINTSGYNYWWCGENHWGVITVRDSNNDEIVRIDPANNGASGTVNGRGTMKVGWDGFCFACWN